jgi:transmembrane sensor
MSQVVTMATYLTHKTRLFAESAEDIAADWIARRNAGLTEEESSALRQWLDGDDQNKRVFEAFDAAWCALGEPRRQGQVNEVMRQLSLRRQHRMVLRRRIWTMSGASLAAASALAWIFLFANPVPSETPLATTMTMRPNIRMLPDGTRVELNAGANIATTYTASERGVRLVHGEVLFEVTKDASRPFVVTAGDIQVRAVGTAFSVRYGVSKVDVVVTEGKVSVEQAGSEIGKLPLYLGVGDKAEVSVDMSQSVLESEITNLTGDEIAAALAWRGKRIEFTGTPLAEAVNLFNRQNRLQLSISDPSLSSRRITGIFWVDDPEGFARLLEAGLNVSASHTSGRIELRSR